MFSPFTRSQGELQTTSGVIAGGTRRGVTSGDAFSAPHRGSDVWTGIPPTWDKDPNATLVVSVICEAQCREIISNTNTCTQAPVACVFL